MKNERILRRKRHIKLLKNRTKKLEKKSKGKTARMEFFKKEKN